jgi:hypothetical protein
MYIELVFDSLKIDNLKNFLEKNCSLIYIRTLGWTFIKLGLCCYIFLHGLLISCFENHMDNCQFVISNANFDTIKKNY